MQMPKTAFEKVLQKAESIVKRLSVELQCVEHLVQSGELPAAYEMALKAASSAERATLVTRTLPAYTGSPCAKHDVELIISESVSVKIGFTIEGWFCLRIPALLPKKEDGSAAYIRSYLYPVMQHFFSYVPPVRYTDCVLIFRHVYSRDRPERQYRDHDNIEVNMVTDIVALYVMPDDAPMKCCHYYCSAAGESDRTEVYVVPRDEFAQWLILEKNIPEEGVKLYEECQKPSQKHM